MRLPKTPRIEWTRRKFRLIGATSVLPVVGYAYAVTYLVGFLALSPFILQRLFRSQGIRARVLRDDVMQSWTGQQTTGLLIYVGRGGKIYLNSKLVSPNELPRALEDEFARRADWSVYVEGDPDVAYGTMVQAMDLVRSAQGKVILLTPEMRAEAQAVHR